MLAELRELWRFRGTLWQLVRRDLKVRYKNSRLGFLWSIAPPLMQVACITFAMKQATTFAADFQNYSAYVLVAMIPWTYFSTALLDSSQSLLSMYGVIRKVYLPREIIPLSAAISNFIHFVLSWAVFAIYWYGIRHGPLLATTAWFPYLILVQFMLVTGLSLLVACLNVFYEDVKYIISVLLGLFLFLLPIMYVVEQVYFGKLSRLAGGWALRLYMLNPLTALINGYRKALLEPPGSAAIGGHQPLPLDLGSLLATGAISLGVLAASYAYFNRRKWQFVERP
ncbi:MAG: ABC transporter permease [Chthonomonadales bacterium]|nr:ABC transporter permease [Chthonomonadales bacterium]